MERPTCKTCPHWTADGHDVINVSTPNGDITGDCTRYPPLVVGWINTFGDDDNGDIVTSADVLFGWPQTGESNSCGEHPDSQAYLMRLEESRPDSPYLE